ncbi:MAG: hypothetical protein HQ501_06915 [Rhodospirillales bacterium]|nr:hypothetical protein [Rhodospirillales bacterium]
MIKKFISNALLSVVMDKDARKKLKGMRPETSDAVAPDKTISNKTTSEKPGVTRKKPLASNAGKASEADAEDVIGTIAEALAEARAEVEKAPRTARKAGAIRNGRDKQAPAPSPSPPRSPNPPAPAQRKASPSSPERDRLIQEALSIQRQNAHILEELDPAMREKLMVMAQYVMAPSSLPPGVRKQAKADARSEGLVDNPGAKAGSLRKKPLPPRK